MARILPVKYIKYTRKYVREAARVRRIQVENSKDENIWGEACHESVLQSDEHLKTRRTNTGMFAARHMTKELRVWRRGGILAKAKNACVQKIPTNPQSSISSQMRSSNKCRQPRNQISVPVALFTGSPCSRSRWPKGSATFVQMSIQGQTSQTTQCHKLIQRRAEVRSSQHQHAPIPPASSHK